MNQPSLIYVTLDLRRGLWVAEATGSIILCSYDSDLLPHLRKRGVEVWCFAELFPNEMLPRSTSELIGHPLILKKLRELKTRLRFLVFKPGNRIKNFLENEGWELLSPSSHLCRKLEDKIDFYELAVEKKIPMPESEVLAWVPSMQQNIHETFGDPFVLQTRMGHAGSSTWIVRKNTPFTDLPDGIKVRVSRFIEGKTYTVNGYLDPEGKVAIGLLFQQLMHVPQWNGFEMGTVGITPVTNLPSDALDELKKLLLQTAKLLHEQEYWGFFGLDLLYDGQHWTLVECNPRFTASISLQCLIDLATNRVPLLRLHADKAPLHEDRFDFLHGSDQVFGHVVLRNSKPSPWKIPLTLKSGIYEREEGNWKLRDRSIDGRDLRVGELLLILAHRPGTVVDPGSDFGAVQYLGSALNEEGQIDDRFFDFYERAIMGYLIRPRDFWEDRYVKTLFEGGDRNPRIDSGENADSRLQLGLHSKPSATSQIQTEIVDGETVKLLGEYRDFFLVERADGTRGWMIASPGLKPSTHDQFQLPAKQSTDAESFFQHWQGKPYLFGGNSEKGIDCSAFVQRYFWEVRGILLPKNSQGQKTACVQQISQEQLQDDDLIFLHHREQKVPHVAVYRHGKVWHSSLEGGVVEQDLEEVKQRYEIDGFGRL